MGRSPVRNPILESDSKSAMAQTKRIRAVTSAARDRRGNALRHLQLLRPRTKAGHGSGERPLGGEDAFKV